MSIILKKKKIIVGVVSVAVFTIGTYFFVRSQKRSEKKIENKKSKTNKKKEIEKKSKVANSDEIENEFEQLEEELDLFGLNVNTPTPKIDDQTNSQESENGSESDYSGSDEYKGASQNQSESDNESENTSYEEIKSDGDLDEKMNKN
ncbi:import receptor subunit tom70 [Anaeramoeba flamelloides]|uniref:Import receptor subunit tom70 n=1 Tax=Anaeramoeba flamelloides TaxID=1746091 RepID=A0ABQ8YE98_9EUKA|nr:import receptor subunit tom70 [Anaeramoeba flamelloides]